MTKQDIAQIAITRKEQRETLTFKRYIQVASWVVKFVFSVNPAYSVIYLVSRSLIYLVPIIRIYVSTMLLDVVIRVVQTKGSVTEVLHYLIILLIIGILDSVFDTLRDYSMGIMEERVQVVGQKRLYEKMEDLGVQTLEDPIISNKISRSESVMGSTLYFFQDLAFIWVTLLGFVTALVIVAREFPIIIPLVIVFSIPWVVLDIRMRVSDWKFYFDTTDERRKAWASAYHLTDPTNLNEISVINASSFLSNKFTSFMDWQFNTRRGIRKGRAFAGFLSVSKQVSYLTGYFLVIQRALLGTISVGRIVFYTDLITRLSDAFMSISSFANRSYEASVRFTDAYDLFHFKSLLPKGNIKLPSLDRGPEVEVTNLNFSYPNSDKLVIENLSLSVKSGEKLAIVGHNGAGKTTLAKLLSRIYLPSDGEILINQIPTSDLEAEALYRNMSVLFQEYNTYPELTVAENVGIGRSEEEISLEKVESALRKADAWDFVSEYPNGMSQILGTRYYGGLRPSTGQWQKIAIARFFYRNAPFVIFDEPTAAIDAVSEYNIFNKIYEFFEGKTVIIISHRFSTVRNADRIIVMENGKIIEQGTHNELMDRDGYYAKSFRLQAEGYSSGSAEPVESIV